MEMLTLKDVAALIGLSRHTAYSVIARADFPKPTVLSKRRLWSKSAVLQWLENLKS